METVKKKHYEYIGILRLIAIILITNSHFDEVYPWPLSWGGAPGNALFFLISGFLIAKIPERERIQHWYLRRVKRIYPSVWAITLVLCITKTYKVTSWGDVFSFFVYPTRYWFVAAMLLLYLLFFLLRKSRVDTHIALAAVVVLYIYKYLNEYQEGTFFVEACLRVNVGMFCMILGAYLRDCVEENRNLKGSGNKLLNLLIACMSVIGFLGIKLLIGRWYPAFYFQFLTHIFSVTFAYNLFLFGMTYEEMLEKYRDLKAYKAIQYISACSLEIYLIQRWIIDLMCNIRFPMNLILIIICICAFASVIHWLVDTISKRIKTL